MSMLWQVLRHHFAEECRKPKLLASFLLGIAMCVYPTAINYLNFARAVGGQVQVLEAYIVVMSTPYQFAAICLGVFLMAADAPFLNDRTAFEVLRIGKRKWMTERLIFGNMACLLYFVVVFLSCMALCVLKGNVYFTNKWSSAMLMLTEKQPEFAATAFRLYFPYPQLTRNLLPIMAAAASFIFGLAYGSLIFMAVMSVSSVSVRRWGVTLALGFHVVGYIINANGPIVISQRFSLLSSSLLAYYCCDLYDMDCYTTVVVMLFLWFFAWTVARRNAGNTDLG